MSPCGDRRLQALPFYHHGQLQLLRWHGVPFLPAQAQPWYSKSEHPAAPTAQSPAPQWCRELLREAKPARLGPGGERTLPLPFP